MWENFLERSLLVETLSRMLETLRALGNGFVFPSVALYVVLIPPDEQNDREN